MKSRLEDNAPPSAVARAMVSEIIADHADDPDFDAEAILGTHPDFQEFPSIVVDLAYEEFCRRVDRGERIDPEKFIGRFPGVAGPLRKLLEVHAFLDENPHAFGAVTELDWPEVGDDVAGFRLVREIGRGGFSRVFLARERALGDREVVLKICFQANEEAARLGQLDHPHIVPVHSVQCDAFPPFTLICMPYLGTTTLADLIEDKADGRTCREAIRLGSDTHIDFVVRKAAELCDALAYAHRRNVWHCDVKPSNVLLTDDGRALLLDFNLAMQHDHAAQVMGGTLPYMAPEQLQYLAGDGPTTCPVDHRTDLFGLGVTVFQLITGRLPYPTEHLDQDRKQAARELLELQRARHSWQEELEQVVSPPVARSIAACLAFDPQDRPESAAVVAADLRRHLGMAARTGRWILAHRVWLSGAALILLIAASVFGVWNYSQPPAYLRHYQLGRGALERQDFAEANLWLDSSLEHRRDFRDARLMRGWSDLLASRRSDIDEATRTGLQQSAYRILRDAWDHYKCAESAASIAQCLAEMGEFREARFYFEKAVGQGFSTTGIANNLGFCLLRDGQMDAALSLLSLAVQLDRSLQSPHWNLLELRARFLWQALMELERSRRLGTIDLVAHHEQSLAEHQQAALSQIQLMREFAPPAAELEIVAARVFAMAIRAERLDVELASSNGRNDLFEELFTACELAIALDLRGDELQEVSAILPELRSEERFQLLLNRNQPKREVRLLRRLVDIFPEVSTRMASFQ